MDGHRAQERPLTKPTKSIVNACTAPLHIIEMRRPIESARKKTNSRAPMVLTIPYTPWAKRAVVVLDRPRSRKMVGA